MKFLPADEDLKPFAKFGRIFSAVLVFVIVTLLFAFILDDKNSSVSHNVFPLFAIDSATATPIDVTGSTLTADWNITFSVKNNNVSHYYENVKARLFYKSDQLLANTTLPSFYQSGNYDTAMEGRFSARLVRVENWAADAIVFDLGRRGFFEFNVRLEARLTRDPGTSSKSQGLVTVECDGVRISPSKAVVGVGEKLRGGSSKCKLQIKYIYENTHYNSLVQSSERLFC